MSIRLLAVLFLLPALPFVFACGGDDDSTPDDGSEATSAANPGFTRPGEISYGSGTIVIDDETFEFEIHYCVQDPDGGILMAGPSTTADGQDVYMDVSTQEPYTRANVDVGIGSTRIIDVSDGDPTYQISGFTAEYEFIPDHVTNPDLVVEVNGEKRISFTGTFFTPRGADAFFNAPGSVDVTCTR